MRLQVEFMSASRSPYARSGHSLPVKKGDPWLFWWTIAIFVLLALTTFSWCSSLYIFRHPEQPRNYRLLAKVRKLVPLKKFNERSVPQGKFHTAKEAYVRYINYSDAELEAQNTFFKRSYIRNYDEDGPVYVKGEFRIYKVGRLSPEQPFRSGLIVRARSVDLPNISIEMIFPTEALPRERPAYGESLVLDTNESFASVLHISRLPEESLCLTVVPITYYSPYPSDPKRDLALSPPDSLNMDAPWPVTDDTPVAEALPVELAGTDEAAAAKNSEGREGGSGADPGACSGTRRDSILQPTSCSALATLGNSIEQNCCTLERV